MPLQGTIFDIQRYSTHDGPGIRTTVFMKGCNLRCYWCHNPESLRPQPEVLFLAAKCIGCGRCAAACEHAAMTAPGRIERDACAGCGACAKACPPKALVLSGRRATVEEILAEAEKDAAFYRRSGGGVTVSGGEALLQADFVAELLCALRRRGIHTAVDTAGDVPFSAFEAVLPHTDLFLFDIKAADPELHRQGCGRDNLRILANLRRLCGAGAPVRLRVPVIPGFNDTPEAMTAIGEIIGSLPGRRPLDLLRFHRMGEAKYGHLGQAYRAGELEPPDDEKMRLLAKALSPHCDGIEIR